MPSVFIGVYRALYPYTAQTNEELTISQNDLLYLLEKSSTDDWWKVKKKIPGSNVEEPSGLVPNNYIQPNSEELSFGEGQILNTYDASDTDWVLVGFNDQYGFVPGNYIDRSPQNSSATRTTREPVPSASVSSAPVQSSIPKQSVQKPLPDMPRNDSDDEYERSPQRDSRKSGSGSRSKPSESPAPAASPAPRREVNTWQVQEIDGKKKYKATLTVFNTGIKFTPSNTSSSYANEWSILDLYYYNSEKKHIFLEFTHPKVSLELHAGSKDAAEEIVSVIGAVAGANKANGLREVITASRSVGHKMGKVLYDFEAQGDDEVSVKEGETIYIINDEESPEWWMVKTGSGKQGVIPSTYIELEKDHKSSKRASSAKVSTRGSSSKIDSSDKYRGHIRDTSKSVPDVNKVRTWSDRTNSFKVEAQLLGCVDGKIHLHKTNGVKIAVAASKMSLEDIEYVERVTGKSLDSEKDSKASSRSHRKGASSSSRAPTYASLSQQAPPPQQAPIRNPNDYDWLNFFLECGIDSSNCNKYAINFNRDQMDESVLEQINPQVLRTLGLKEGDILRVMKKLDEKYHRSGVKQLPQQQSAQPPIQQLQPQPAPVQQLQPIQPQPAPVQPMQPQQPAVTGFTDSAWTVKTPAQPQTTSFASAPLSSTQSLPSNQPTGALKDLLDFGPRPAQPAKSASTTVLPQTQVNPIASTPTGGVNFLQPNRTGGATAVVTVPVSIPIQFQPVASISVQPANPFNAPQQPLQPTITGGNIFNAPIQPVITGGNIFNPQVQRTVTGGNAFATPLQPTITGGNVFAQPTITGGNPFAPQPTVTASNTFAQPTITGGNTFAQPTLTGGNIFNTPAQPSLTGGNIFANPVQSSLTGGNIFNAPIQSQPPGGNVFNAPLQNQMTGSAFFNAPVQPQRTGGFTGNAQPSFGTNSFNAGFTSHPSGSVPNLSAANPFAIQQPANPFGLSQPHATTGSGMFGGAQPVNTLANQFSQVSLQPQQQSQFGFQQQQQQLQPLQSQATGFGFGNTTSAPAVSFGAAPLQPTLTGRRANLASATPQNPFGF
ncbi:hypothetical protein D0Z00_003917 [Geotrichum galactomycetum]|uniref:Uncharacterized protein n=1 Tax=Geotrichum galactomycetum TaxID=27317 RepID=A0ACB6V078_9ASCO|nr:hypothetical protein D0Z00_003917 [Geotrichum candidum]